MLDRRGVSRFVFARLLGTCVEPEDARCIEWDQSAAVLAFMTLAVSAAGALIGALVGLAAAGIYRGAREHFPG